MFKSQKHAFWQALIITIIIFGMGIIAGVALENWRTSQIDLLAQESEIDLLDMRLQSEIYSEDDFDCESAIRENLNFADRIFNEAKLLDRYEGASRLTEKIQIQHKKYDILRVMLLLNSKRIKERCDTNYHDIVYFYKYNDASTATKTKQSVFSRVLSDLKEEMGPNMLLIPMAGDNDIASINIILDSYGVAVADLPVVVIDGDILVKDLKSVTELKSLLKLDSGLIKL
jgi:hypothetical protein